MRTPNKCAYSKQRRKVASIRDLEARLRKTQLTLEYAVENRRAEISLLWTRSAYFWAFLVVAIASYGAAFQNHHRTLALLVACFAAICSLCWTLANRSGKYWQEVWEKKVESLEQTALSEAIFDKSSNGGLGIEEKWFWGAKQYSPSRLASAVSDLAFAIWAMVAFFTTFTTFIDFSPFITLCRAVLLLITIIYGLAILFWCRSGAPKFSTLAEAWTQLRDAWTRWRTLPNG